MATPKIKLYRLFPGYSSQNDNDIQSATNDLLLPVTLKNIMPTNAYTLIGVGKKLLLTLIPVLSLDELDSKYLSTPKACLGTNGVYTLPDLLSTDPLLNSYIVANRTNVMPIFCLLNTDGTYTDYIPGVDYIYVRDMNYTLLLKTVPSQLKFVVYYLSVLKRWYVKYVNTNNLPGELYVKNLYRMLLNKVQVLNLTFSDIQYIYYLTKTAGVNQVVGDKHEFIPVVGDYVSYHLRPTISFTVTADEVMSASELEEYTKLLSLITSSSSDSSSSLDEDSYYIKTVYLTLDSNSFTIDLNFRLTGVNNNSIGVTFGKNTYYLPSGLVYKKSCTLTYYTIPTLKELRDTHGVLNSNNLMFMSQEQDVYNGTKNAAKPNTLYLLFVQSGKMQIQKENQTVQNYVIKTDTLTDTIKAELGLSTLYCRGIIPKGVSNAFQLSGIRAKFRYVYYNDNELLYNNYIQANYIDKNLKFPDSLYLLDVLKGLYYFRVYDGTKYIKKNFDDTFVANNDYFFSTYYHRVALTKTFVSDFQSWVVLHLRNNPDVFYGKKDYTGDDYIDANENAIKVGAIPQFLLGGYSISFRNGVVTFAADTQDIDYVGADLLTDGSSGVMSGGVMSGGVARANFAYYNGLLNVLDQKLLWDKSYTGGGYKYRALNDKKYPDSIGRRWVKRLNPLQFIGASFVTEKLNDKDLLTTYNLPDLLTVQLLKLNKYGFAKCMIHTDENDTTDYSKTAKIFIDYYITTNNFSYPFAFKISNTRRLLKDGDKLYLTSMTLEMLKQRHPNLMGLDVTRTFELNAEDKFELNLISFETLENLRLDRINVKFSLINILPAIKVTVPVLTLAISGDSKFVLINKNSLFEYSDFTLYYHDGNGLVQIKNVYNYTLTNDKVILLLLQLLLNYSSYDSIYLKYRMTTSLYRSYDEYNSKMLLYVLNVTGLYSDDSSSSDSSDSSYNNGNYNGISIGANYKIQKQKNNLLIFSISNANQTTYFKLSVVDFYSVENSYNSTIVYTIKKYDL